VLLAAAFVLMMYWCQREYSVRSYLDGFSDAIVPNSLPAEQKVQAILDWMRAEPSRVIAADPDTLSKRDPEMTLTYKQLLNVCGTATNAFLNLARSSDLRVRRLLLLSPDHNTKHVVAEVLIGERWIIVDPTYRVIMKDGRGHSLTRNELKNPAVFAEAAVVIPNYPREYNYDQLRMCDWRDCRSRGCIWGDCWIRSTRAGMKRSTGACSWSANPFSTSYSPPGRHCSSCCCGPRLPGMRTAD
jgi:hypothetical protein